MYVSVYFEPGYYLSVASAPLYDISTATLRSARPQAARNDLYEWVALIAVLARKSSFKSVGSSFL